MNELIHTAINIAQNQYGNRGTLQARRLHAAVLLRRAADELARLVREQTADDDLRAAIDEAIAAYPTRTELRASVGLP